MELNNSNEIKEVTSRIARAKSFVRDWKTNIEHWRDLYNNKHYSGIDQADETRYNDPTYTNTVDLAVGIMLANKLRWHAFGFEPSKQEQVDTANIEKLIEGIWDVNDEREERSNAYELFLNFIRDGGGVIYSVFDPKIAQRALIEIDKVDPNSPTGTSKALTFNEPPIRIQIIDPLKVFAIPGGPKRWLLIGRQEEMSILDVEYLYNTKIPTAVAYSSDEKALIMGEFNDVWDYTVVDGAMKVRNTIMYNGLTISGPRIMEGYTELPYDIQFFKPTMASSPKGWHNITTALEDSVKQLEKTVNRRAHQIDVYTGLPIVTKTQMGRVVQIDNIFNHVNISTDEEIAFPQWPGNAPDVQLHMDFLRTRVNQSGFSDVMYGTGSGEAAGYAMAQQSDQNRMRLEQPIKHLELMLTSWARKTLTLLQTFGTGASICVYGHKQGQDYKEYVEIDDLKGYAIKSEIRPHFPAEQARKTAMATQVKGILSNYTIMERYLDIEQPEDEQDRQMIEAASMHPLLIQYAITAELTERAKAGDEIAAQVLQSMQQQGTPGEPGRPKDPNSPEGMTNMPSATGQLTSQEQGGAPAGQSPMAQQQNAGMTQGYTA